MHPAYMRPKHEPRKRFNADRAIGLTAMLISLLTLLAFGFQTYVVHQQGRLSVTPRLEFGSSLNIADSLVTYTFSVRNKGIGPAIIKQANILHNGEAWSADPEHFYESNFPELFELGYFDRLSTLSPDQAISQGETLELMINTFNEDLSEVLREYLQMGDSDYPLRLRLEYASIYEDSWIMESSADGELIRSN